MLDTLSIAEYGTFVKETGFSAEWGFGSFGKQMDKLLKMGKIVSNDAECAESDH